MNQEEFLKAIKKARKIFGYVQYSDNDACYLQIKRENLKYFEASAYKDAKFNATMDNNTLYIN
jgi:hypothetical protein